MNDPTVHRFLAFSLGQEEYAVPLLKVKEVIATPQTTPVPFTPSHFLGIMNLRGQIISIIDLRKKFGLKVAENMAEAAVIILNLDDIFLGVVVDSVNKVFSLTDGEISDPPGFLENGSGASIIGVSRKDAKLILLLDIAKTLDVDDLMAIKKTVETKVA